MEKTGLTIFFKEKVTKGLSKISNMGDRTFRRITSMSEKFEKSVNQGANKVTKLRDRLSQLNKTGGAGINVFGRLKSVLAGLVVFGGLSTLGSDMVNTTAKFERFDAVLTNTLQSASGADKAMNNIVEFASKTPFQVDELTDSFVKLTNRGFQPSMGDMKKMGDLSSSVGKGFNQLSEAILDATTGEFERLKEFGIKARKSGDQVTFSFKGVSKTVKFTDSAIHDYILSLGDLQGVQGSMAAISETMGGRISNLGDKFTMFKLQLGKALRPVIIKVIDALGDLLERGGKLINWVVEHKKQLMPFVKGIGIAAIAYGVFTAAQWALNVAMNANPIMLIVTALAALSGAVIYAYNNFEGFRNFIDRFWAGLRPFIIEIKEDFTRLFTNIGNLFAGTGQKALGFGETLAKVLGFVAKLAGIGLKIWLTINSVVLKVINGIVSAVRYVLPHIVKLWDKMEGFRSFLWSLWDTVKKVFTWIADKLSGVFGWIGKTLNKVLGAIGINTGELVNAFKGGFVGKNPPGKTGDDGKDGQVNPGFTLNENSADFDGNLNQSGAITDVTGGDRNIRNVSINLNNLVGSIEMKVTKLDEGLDETAEKIKATLLAALNDANLALSS